MLLKELVKILDKLFKKSYAVAEDPVGLQLGKPLSEINKALITLDVNADVIDEAILQKTGLIIAHHPMIYYPLKDIRQNTLLGSKIFKLIENNISVYIAHTSLDSMPGGINEQICEKLGLEDVTIIEETQMQWYKFAVFSPPESENNIREAMFKNGGGQWANYSCCSFNSAGRGTFRPGDKANPYKGIHGEINFVKEVKIECVVSAENLRPLTKAVLSVHPYEEPAYDIYKIENRLNDGGLARAGRLSVPVSLLDFMKKIKSVFGIKSFRWLSDKSLPAEKIIIESVAVANGSANSLTDRVYISDKDIDLIMVGELRYSNVLDIIQSGKIVIELGHGESEKIAIDIIYDMLFSRLSESEGLKLIKSKNGYAGWRYFFE